MILCDTDVIIEFYKENPQVIRNLRSIGEPNIAISIITSGELLYGAINKRELNQISKDIGKLNLIHINKEIGDCFNQLLIKYSLSHRFSVPDGLIASTALIEKIQLYTHNLLDFKFIDGLQLYQEKP